MSFSATALTPKLIHIIHILNLEISFNRVAHKDGSTRGNARESGDVGPNARHILYYSTLGKLLPSPDSISKTEEHT